MEQQAILFSIAETIKNGAREVTSAPNNWFKNGKLLWPNKGASTKRKNRAEPESDWEQYDYKILKTDIGSLREALASEKKYSLYSNSESEIEAMNRKNYLRLHPAGTKNPIDANDIFDKTKKDSGISENKDSSDGIEKVVVLEDIVFDAVLPDNLFQGPEAYEIDLNVQIGTSIVATQNQNEEYQPTFDIGSIVNISNVMDINKDSCSTIVSGEYQDQQNALKNQVIPLENSLGIGTVNASGNSVLSSQYQHQSRQHKYQSSDSQHQGQPQQYQHQNQQYLGQHLHQPQQYQVQQKQDYFQQNDYSYHQSQGQQNQYQSQQNLNQSQPYLAYLNNINREDNNRQRNHHNATSGNSTSSVSHAAIKMSNLPDTYNTTYDVFANATTSQSLKYGQCKEKSNKINRFRNVQPITLKNANGKKPPNPRITKNIGKENGCKSTKVKNSSTKRSKIDILKLAKGKGEILKKKNQILSVTKSNQNKESGRNDHIKVPDRNTKDATFGLPTEKALGNMNKFTPGPINKTTDSVASIEYLPFIYKEVMAMKQFNLAEAAKRQKNDEKLAIVEQAQEQIFEKLGNMERIILEEMKMINPQVNLLTPEDIKMIDGDIPKELVDLVEDFEVKLDSDPIYKNKITLRMKKLGGKKANLMVRSVMKRLITDPVLDRYTWKGIGKKCFANLTNINDVVYNAVSGVFKKYTLHKYGKYMVEFLKHSSSRQREPIKYRKKRDGDDERTNQNYRVGDDENDEINYGDNEWDNKNDEDEDNGKDEDCEEDEKYEEEDEEDEEDEDEDDEGEDEDEDEDEDDN